MKIPVFVINLKRRTDRLKNVLKEFEGKLEFNVIIVEAIEHQVAAIGLWETIRYILKDLANKGDEYIIICEDDHEFTGNYSKAILLDNIAKAQRYEADILCGGVSWASSILEIEQGMFWVEKFTGLQFTIVFRKSFEKMLNADFRTLDAADYKLSELSLNKFFVFPFISIQTDYGYSDVTSKNNAPGKISDLFRKSNEMVNIIRGVTHYYQHNKDRGISAKAEELTNVMIPTYIINLPERAERRRHIEAQFAGRKEFDIKFIEACKHEIGAIGLWLSIRKVVQIAIGNDDDVIIICEDDHEFTKDYNEDFLIKNILEAGEQGCDILNGGIGKFGRAVFVAPNRFWVDSFCSTQFVVLYRKFFQQVLNETFLTTDVADLKYSEMTSNKMVMFPFISNQHDFGYSDVTPIHNEVSGIVQDMFAQAESRLERYRMTHGNYFQEDYLLHNVGN